MSACWFHFTQAVSFHSKLITLIKSDQNAQRKKLLCFPLLPAHEIQGAFEMLKLQAMATNAKVFRKFIKYYEDQWLIKVSWVDLLQYKSIEINFNLFRNLTWFFYYFAISFQFEIFTHFLHFFMYTGGPRKHFSLGSHIPKRAQFFRFLLQLRIEEKNKALQAGLLVDRGGSSAANTHTHTLKQMIHNNTNRWFQWRIEIYQTADSNLKTKKNIISLIYVHRKKKLKRKRIENSHIWTNQITCSQPKIILHLKKPHKLSCGKSSN